MAEVGAADSSVDLWDTITHEERDGSACMQTTKRSEGDGDGREKRIGSPEKLRKLQMAFYRKAKAEPKWRLVHANQNLPLTLVRQPRCQFWILAHPNRRLAVYFRTLYFVDPCLVCSAKQSSFEPSPKRVNRLLASMGGLGFFGRLGEFSLGRHCQLHRSF